MKEIRTSSPKIGGLMEDVGGVWWSVPTFIHHQRPWR
jgi:hypothetical protein